VVKIGVVVGAEVERGELEKLIVKRAELLGEDAELKLAEVGFAVFIPRSHTQCTHSNSHTHHTHTIHLIYVAHLFLRAPLNDSPIPYLTCYPPSPFIISRLVLEVNLGQKQNPWGVTPHFVLPKSQKGSKSRGK